MSRSLLDVASPSRSTNELLNDLRLADRAVRTSLEGEPIDVDDLVQEFAPADGAVDRPDYLNPRVIDLRDQPSEPVELSACPVCESRTGRPRFGIELLPHQVVVCEGCGLGRLTPLPSRDELAAFYPPGYYGSPGAKFEPLTEAVIRFIGTVHVRSLSKSLPRQARILDVGCGRGVLLGSLADRGHEVHGMDVSETAVAGTDPRAHIKVAGCLRECAYPADHFDQVILWHVLEHLTNPREVLEEIHRILKPGGQVIVAVPNFSSLQARWSGPAWFHLDLPRHLYHFPVKGLRRLLERTAFDVVREQHFSLRQNPFGWVQSTLNKSEARTRNELYNLLHHHGAKPVPVGRTKRLAMKAGYLATMPPALGMSLWATLCRSGASVCLVGRKS